MTQHYAEEILKKQQFLQCKITCAKVPCFSKRIFNSGCVGGCVTPHTQDRLFLSVRLSLSHQLCRLCPGADRPLGSSEHRPLREERIQKREEHCPLLIPGSETESSPRFHPASSLLVYSKAVEPLSPCIHSCSSLVVSAYPRALNNMIFMSS